MGAPWHEQRPLVCLAPMEGVTDSPFRRLCREIAPRTIVFTEFASAKGLLHGSDRAWEMIAFQEVERPLVVQLFGAEPEDLAAAARSVVERVRPDGIDLNLGCPVRKVLRRGEGCALMQDPERASAIIRAIKQAVDVPVSAKMRLGWEQREEAVPFALALEEAGAEVITVHGRLRRERPRHPADWESIARVKEALSIPVVGNGDLWSMEDARRRIEESGVDGVMIGRGAMGNPWLLRDVWHWLAQGDENPPSDMRERLRVILRHLALNVEKHGEKRGVLTMRKHYGRYLLGFPGAREVRRRLMEPVTVKGVREVLESIPDVWR